LESNSGMQTKKNHHQGGEGRRQKKVLGVPRITEGNARPRPAGIGNWLWFGSTQLKRRKKQKISSARKKIKRDSKCFILG